MGLSAKVTLPDLVIPVGQTESNALSFQNLRFLQSLTIHSPESLTGTLTVEVTSKRNPGGTDWKDLTSGGSVVTLAAGEALPITDVAFAGLRVKSSSAEASERHFGVTGRE